MTGFVDSVWMTFQILLGTFIILTLAFNFNSSWKIYPWDISVDRFGFHVYIPVITSLGIAVLLTMLLRVLPIGPASFFNP
jgi:hypothetical protein